MWIFKCTGVSTTNPHIVQGQLYIILQLRKNIKLFLLKSTLSIICSIYTTILLVRMKNSEPYLWAITSRWCKIKTYYEKNWQSVSEMKTRVCNWMKVTVYVKGCVIYLLMTEQEIVLGKGENDFKNILVI